MQSNPSSERPGAAMSIPPRLIALDLFATFNLVLGLADGPGRLGLVPEALRFPHYAAVLVVIGLLLNLPLVLHIVRMARDRGTRGGGPGTDRRHADDEQ